MLRNIFRKSKAIEIMRRCFHVAAPKTMLAVLILSYATHTCAQNLRICIVNDNIPYSFKEQGLWQGFDVEVFNKLNLPNKYEMVEAEFAVALAMLEQNKCNMLLPSIKVTDNIKERFLVSAPHLVSNLRALVLKDSPLENKSDLEGGIVGVLKGDTAEAYALLEFTGATIIALYEEEELVQLLLDGEIESILGNVTLLRKLQKQNASLELLKPVLKNEQFAFIFPKNEETLRNQVNAQVKALQNNGAMSQLYEKWFN